MTGEVRCIDLRDGKTIWSAGGVEGERLLRSAVMILGDRVVATLPSGAVVSLDTDSGETVWKTRLPGRLNTSPVVIADVIHVGDTEGRIHRLSSLNGKALAAFEGESPVYGSLLSAGDCLLALWGEDSLACLDSKAGTVKWSRKTSSTWSSFQPLVQGDEVVVGTESGEIHAFELSDGATAWMRQVEGEIKGLGADDGVLYVGTSQGRVYALRLPDLERRESDDP